MRLCPNCNQPVNDSDFFCIHCGTRLKKQCPNCRQYNDVDVNFCVHCGYSFSSSSSQMNQDYQSQTANYSLSARASESVSNSVARLVSARVSASVSSSVINRARAYYRSESQFRSASISQMNRMRTSASIANRSRASSLSESLEESSVVSRSSRSTSGIMDKVNTAMASINKWRQTKISKIVQEHRGANSVLDNNKELLQQAYATRYPKRKLPKIYQLVNLYNVSSYRLRYRLKLINKMLVKLNYDNNKLKMPIWINYYSYLYQNYVNQVKGAEGERWACNNLKHNDYHSYAHNVNIPFDYQRYYRKAYHDARHFREKYFKKGDYKQSKKYNRESKYLYRCYQYSRKFPEKNGNQVDILYINNYGIFIFEVKTFCHKEIWISQNGQIEWLNRNDHRGAQDSPFKVGSLTIQQQLKLHRAAILSILKKNQTVLSLSRQTWNQIVHNIFGILVYIKAPKSARGKIGVYKYNRGKRDYSRDLHIPVVDQNHCYQAVRDNSKQYTFTDAMVDKLRKSIIPKYEKGFKLPIFKRNNIDSLNMILNYKHEVNYVYKLLRHLCYSKGILKSVVPRSLYKHYLINRSQKYHRLHNLYLLANYWYLDYHHQWHRTKDKDKSRHNIQYWHRKDLKRYHRYRKLYCEFYK